MSDEEYISIRDVFEDKKRKKIRKKHVIAIVLVVILSISPIFIFPRILGKQKPHAPGFETFQVLEVSGTLAIEDKNMLGNYVNISFGSSLILKNSELRSSRILLDNNSKLVLVNSRLIFDEIKGKGSLMVQQSTLIGGTVIAELISSSGSLLNCTIVADDIALSKSISDTIIVEEGTLYIKESTIKVLAAENAKINIIASNLNATIYSAMIELNRTEMQAVIGNSNITAFESVLSVDLVDSTGLFYDCLIDRLKASASLVKSSTVPMTLIYDNYSILVLNTSFTVEFYDIDMNPAVGAADIYSTLLDQPIYIGGQKTKVSVPSILIAYGSKRYGNITVITSGFVTAILGSPFSNMVANIPPDFSGTLKIIVGESDIKFVESTAIIEELKFSENYIYMKAMCDEPAKIVLNVPWEPARVTLDDAELIMGATPGWIYVNGTLIISLPPCVDSEIVIYRTEIAVSPQKQKDIHLKVMSIIAIIAGILSLLLIVKVTLCLPPKFLAATATIGIICIVVVAFIGWQIGALTALIAISALILVGFLVLRRTCPIPS